MDKKLASLGLGNNESNFKDNDKNHLDVFSKPKQTDSILNKIKTMKFSDKRSKESLSQVDNDNQWESEFGINEGLKETEGRSINDINKDYIEMNQEGTRTSTPLDLKQSTNGNIDLNEIDKIQKDILKTLKRLGDS
jgi:hypothetical protein